ncbi:hypothetical protein V8E52_000736 [Russula decolorans]
MTKGEKVKEEVKHAFEARGGRARGSKSGRRVRAFRHHVKLAFIIGLFAIRHCTTVWIPLRMWCGTNAGSVLSSEAPLELAAELLVNAVFNRSSNQRLRLRKVKFGYLHGDSSCKAEYKPCLQQSECGAMFYSTHHHHHFQLETHRICAPCMDTHPFAASRSPVGNKVVVLMPVTASESENGWHHPSRKGARSESHETKGEVFKVRVLSVCVERDKTASEDETDATRQKAKHSGWPELEEKTARLERKEIRGNCKALPSFLWPWVSRMPRNWALGAYCNCQTARFVFNSEPSITGSPALPSCHSSVFRRLLQCSLYCGGDTSRTRAQATNGAHNIPPPIATRWAAAKILPAAIEPIDSKGLDVASIVRWNGTYLQQCPALRGPRKEPGGHWLQHY